MLARLSGSLCSMALLASSLYAQGLNTNATKDDWEEINFEFNSSILSDGYPTLLRIADLLKQHADYKIKVEGHTDYVGSDAYNEKLALSRADTVKSFLVKYGVPAGAIQTSGQGKRVPEVPNTTKEGRFINRRVVLTVTDGQGRVVAAGSAPDVVKALAGIDDRLKKLEDCCSAILKKLDKLDEILAALRDLKAENDRLKADVANLKNRPQAPPPVERPTTSPQQVTDIVKSETAKALEEHSKGNPKFAVLGANVGPSTYGGASVSGKGRFFGVFGQTHAVQAEGEFMYYSQDRLEGRTEGQFDIGLVNRWGPVQAGTFASFKTVNLRQYQKTGTLGQAAFTLDYVFNRGRLGFFGTKGFLDNAVINRVNLGPSSFLETYLKIVDQYGGSALIGVWKDAYIEGNLGYLRRTAGGRPGGMIRLVQPLNQRLALTVEGGLNETLITSNDSGRVVFGLQFGNWLRPKEYGQVKHPVPVDIPRVRYEMLTRKVGNSAPIADAGPDQIGVAAGTITLDGSGSYDPDGDTLTYQWTQVGGPTVSISGVNTAKATFTGEAGQEYIFRLKVTDPGGLFSQARVRVSVRAAPQVRILKFTAQPNVIQVDQSSVLSWAVENADTVEITGIGQVAASGTSSVSPRETTTYRLTATNKQGALSETVTVTVQRPQTTVLRFSASPASITAGEVSTLNWEVQNATDVSISPGIGAVQPNGTRTVSPTETTVYTLTARGVTGQVVATASVSVVKPGAPRILRFTGTPPEIATGETASLSWQVEGADSVSISPDVGTVQPTGSATVTPTANTTYILTAKNANGDSTASVTISVFAPVKINDFTANPTVVITGKTSTLTWSTTNATDVVITGIGKVPVNGSQVVTLTSDTSYTLIAYGKRGQASAFLTIKVIPDPANRPPVANAGPNTTIARNSTNLDGSKSYDPDGNTPLTYSWRFVTFVPDPVFPPGGSTTPTITGANTVNPSVLFPQFGQYVFELKVTNTKGLSSSAVVRITVVDP